ncbi:MAG: hypothetical protein L6R48_21750 [Planctomycetes bacterium]|nr:hypothetical protein [Planctomycetota bacterium]
MGTWQTSISERVTRFQAFHRRANPRPLLGFFRGSEYPLFRYPFSARLPAGRPLQPEDFDVEAFAGDCERLFLEHEACGGEFIYAASAFWGIPWLEAALGCAIVADHGSGTGVPFSPCLARPLGCPRANRRRPCRLPQPSAC